MRGVIVVKRYDSKYSIKYVLADRSSVQILNWIGSLPSRTIHASSTPRFERISLHTTFFSDLLLQAPELMYVLLF